MERRVPPWAEDRSRSASTPTASSPPRRWWASCATRRCSDGKSGFDGVMTSEHHGGFAGYMPNPLQAAGWLLEAMPTGWAAPCPLLLPLRPPALVAEEVAWLAARFPGRVGVGLAAGSLQADFDIMGLTKEDLTRRFARGLDRRGRRPGRHGPRAVWAATLPSPGAHTHPVPVVSAAMSTVAVRPGRGPRRRPAVRLAVDARADPRPDRRVPRGRRATAPACSCGACGWELRPGIRSTGRLDRYRSYAAAGAQVHWQGEQMVAAADAATLAGELAAVADRAGVDALNLRIHVPGVAPATARHRSPPWVTSWACSAVHRVFAEPHPR